MHQPSSQQQGLLEDLLPPSTPTPTPTINWSTFPSTHETQLFPNEEDYFLLLSSSSSSSSLLQHFISQPPFQSSYYESSIYPSCFDTFTPINASPYDQQTLLPLMVEEEDDHDHGHHHEKQQKSVSSVVSDDQIPTVFSMGLNGEKKSRSNKIDGQPSKNLMAERRRRKRLNDRLSMLRSIVPKISRMDRTSILGDTIDYMKELVEKIRDLKEQDLELDHVDQSNLVGNFKEFNINGSQTRNSQKFDVERGNTDTRINICCSTKPGLLLSTINTLEAVGLDIQQCVISCYNDFSLQASCNEARDHRSVITTEELKQILFRNAGYGGRCS